MSSTVIFDTFSNPFSFKIKWACLILGSLIRWINNKYLMKECLKSVSKITVDSNFYTEIQTETNY